jgi:hypothetical protein
MDALDLVLTGFVAVLASALALMLLARLRDLRTIRTEAVELEAARTRIAELERTRDRRELAPARRFSRV